jgi:branched-chain amino acid transport system permease protein
MTPETAVVQALNGISFGALLFILAAGLSLIFGMMDVVNLAHGAFYMLGAFGAYILLDSAGVGFWIALVAVPVVLGVFGMALERLFIHRLASLDPLYNFLLTFGIALILQDLVKREYGVQSKPYPRPDALSGQIDLGLFSYPTYQVFVLAFSVAICFGMWFLLARTRVGMIVRASTERADVTRALGVNVGLWVTPVFGFGIALAALAGVLAAPMRAVNPLMGADLILVVFAVVVIGGLGSIFGSVIAGFLIGMLQALGNLYVPALSQTLVFILMAIVLLWRPAGLFGREEAPA